jgi:nitrite reductase/ring-hydroxylating ferredoxin subunit
MRFNHDEMHIVCPWHGWEFDIANGEAVADRKWKLRSYDVEVRGEDVYVLL